MSFFFFFSLKAFVTVRFYNFLCTLSGVFSNSVSCGHPHSGPSNLYGKQGCTLWLRLFLWDAQPSFKQPSK